MGILHVVYMVRQAHHGREGDEERVLAAVTVHSSSPVSEDTAV